MGKNVGPLLNEAGNLVMQDMEKTELLNAFLLSVFTSKTGIQESKVLETRRKGWSKGDVPLVEEDYLRNQGILKQTGYTQDAPMSAEGAGLCHCKATLKKIFV